MLCRSRDVLIEFLDHFNLQNRIKICWKDAIGVSAAVVVAAKKKHMVRDSCYNVLSHVCVSQSMELLVIANKHIMIVAVPDLSTFQCENKTVVMFVF